MLSFTVNLDWVWQIQVKNAFLKTELEYEVYMRPPPGLVHLVKPGNVRRLNKEIYGLKQSSRALYHKLSTTLNGRGFIKSEADNTLSLSPVNKASWSSTYIWTTSSPHEVTREVSL